MNTQVENCIQNIKTLCQTPYRIPGPTVEKIKSNVLKLILIRLNMHIKSGKASPIIIEVITIQKLDFSEALQYFLFLYTFNTILEIALLFEYEITHIIPELIGAKIYNNDPL